MSCCAAIACDQNLAREALSRNQRLEEERIISASVRLSDGQYKTDFIVPEMHCVACIGTIERGLVDIAPVLQVRANLSQSKVSVIWDPSKGSIATITDRLDELGFENHLGDLAENNSSINEKSKSLLIALAVAGFAAANIMLLSVSVWSGADPETARLFNLISGLIAVPAVLFAGQPFFRSALAALSAKRLNMDVPISLAVLLALGMSLFESMTGGLETYFDASVTLLFFLLIGRYLDTMMRQKARTAVEQLAKLSSKFGVRVLPDGTISHLALNEIKPGMMLRIFPGERFPVNGQLTSGPTDIDCSHVTGESDHLVVNRNHHVEAGSLNLSSAVDMMATTDAEHSFLGEMQRMISEAENGRSHYLRIADRMAQIYAPAVHLLALIAFVGWMIVSGGDWHLSIYTAIAVLIVTCPCALGLAVPVAHVIAANRLMQCGILMNDGSALERLSEVQSVVFDKTGTLTNGMPKVSRVRGDLQDFKSVIKGMALTSSHPACHAIKAYLGDASPLQSLSISEFPGKGVEALIKGKRARLGKPDWVSQISIENDERVPDCSMAFALEGKPATLFDTDDMLRKDAGEAVQELIRFDLDVEILSGDQEAKVAKIAKTLGLMNFKARQMPDQKIERVVDLQTRNKKVLMVGDGINDAPALTAGHVSIVPASASDIGRHAADFVFTRNSLWAVPFAYHVAMKTRRIVKQNFGLAIAYNCIAVPLAMMGLITPLVAAIAMSASSIVVVANSFRINFLDLEITGDLPANTSDAHEERELVTA